MHPRKEENTEEAAEVQIPTSDRCALIDPERPFSTTAFGLGDWSQIEMVFTESFEFILGQIAR
jgi:hypothetical protein